MTGRSIKFSPLLLAAFAVAIAIGFPGCKPKNQPSTAAAPAIPAETEVVVFNPPVPSAVEEGGRCWTDSIAVSRPGAWRCMRENMIFDPCFAIPHQAQQVVCGADPAKGERGFVLKLTEPLQTQPPAADRSAQPWMIELADGTICSATTGTMAAIEGESVRFPCAASKPTGGAGDQVYAGLLGTLYPSKVWTADEVWFTVAPNEEGLPFKVIKRTTVPIRRVWE